MILLFFCWVLHQQEIIDTIIERLDVQNCKVRAISLMAEESQLRKRLNADVHSGRRTADVIDRSVARLPLYRELMTIKIDTSGKSVQQIVDRIKAL